MRGGGDQIQQRAGLCQIRPLSLVAIQNDVPTVWAETPNDFAGYEERTIETFGTGHLIPADAVYLATLLMMNDALVLHFYEVLQ